jgi:hypothetical protein
MQQGPTVFSSEEKKIFHPLYEKVRNKELNPRQVLEILGGDKSTYKRFTDYLKTAVDLQKGLLSAREKVKKTQENLQIQENRSVFLTQKIATENRSVEASRNSATQNIVPQVGTVKVGPGGRRII